MTTILAIFVISSILSLLFTPAVGKLGKRFGALDAPGDRKIHLNTIPRTGGVAVFLVFFITLFISSFFMTLVSNQLELNRTIIFLLSAG